MNIDKTRFLLLTTTLAAGTVVALSAMVTGCTVNTVNNEDSGTTNPNTTIDAGNTTSDAASDADSGNDGGAEACLAAAAAGPACGPATEGEDAGAFAKCSLSCDTASSFFKSDIAKSISACLDKAVPDPTVEGACDDAAPACAAAAIAKSCDDSVAPTYCTTLIPKCADSGPGAVTQTDCVALVRATTQDGRNALDECVGLGRTCADCFDALKAVAGE